VLQKKIKPAEVSLATTSAGNSNQAIQAKTKATSHNKPANQQASKEASMNV
jgi:hypothetical protein